MKIKQVIREHRSIVILFGFELLVLIWAFCLLFGERTVIDINPENADYFNSCTINDGKLQINQSENEVGIDIVSAEYKVEYKAPDAPTISPRSGVRRQ